MKVIQSELGEGDPWTREVYELQTRIESAELPEEIQVRTLKEVARLGQMPMMAPEVGIIRSYMSGFWIYLEEASEDNSGCAPCSTGFRERSLRSAAC